MRAFVLHQRNYRETSQLVDLFSDELGLLRVVAKATRQRAKRGARQPLYAFMPLWVSCSHKGELRQLLKYESQGLGHDLTGEKWLCGMYLNELLLRLLAPYEPQQQLFDYYQHSLNNLIASQLPEAWVLRCFEKELLKRLGYEMPLLEQEFQAEQFYDYLPDRGFKPVSATQVGAYCGAALIALTRNELPDIALLPQLKRLLRQALTPHLGDKPLQTLQLARHWLRHEEKTT